MDLSKIEPAIGIRTWQEAAAITETMNATESSLAWVAFVNAMAQHEVSGGVHQSDGIYSMRSAVAIAYSLTQPASGNGQEIKATDGRYWDGDGRDESPF